MMMPTMLISDIGNYVERIKTYQYQKLKIQSFGLVVVMGKALLCTWICCNNNCYPFHDFLLEWC